MPLQWPINLAAEIVDITDLSRVSFAMFDAGKQVRCEITALALTERATHDKRQETLRQTFDRCRGEIENLASKKYDSGENPPIITNSDF